MVWSEPAIRPALDIVWQYMRLVHPPVASDAILVLGSFDPHVAIHGARLWHDRLAPLMIVSGGMAHKGGLLDTGWDRPEAEVFRDLAIEHGVPSDAILVEDQAQNTFENFTRSQAIAARAGLKPQRLLVVAKPYMTRRGFATGRKAWTGIELRMQCEPIGLIDYFARESDPERTVQAMVGDLHRILVYPQLGFQIEQEVPLPVRQALRMLVGAGYGQRLVPGYGID